MNGTTFDALDATETLERAGFDERQAKAVAGVVRQAVAADRDTLATKADIAATQADIAALRADVRADIADLRADNADLRAYMDKLETRLTVRLFGGLFAVASLNVAAMAALKLFG